MKLQEGVWISEGQLYDCMMVLFQESDTGENLRAVEGGSASEAEDGDKSLADVSEFSGTTCLYMLHRDCYH